MVATAARQEPGRAGDERAAAAPTRGRRPARPARLLTAAALTAGVVAAVVGSPAGPASAAPSLAVTPAAAPAFAGDAPDPDVVVSGGTAYAFTTGTALGNHLQVLVDTTGSLTSGWRSYTGLSYGSSALPDPPAWETVNTQTSPGVFYWGGRWVMYYDAATDGQPGDTGSDCLAMATAATLSPTDPVFTDTSTSPFLCQPDLGGAIDPSPFVDPATGTAYLLWKSNDGGSVQPGRIWAAPLNAQGTGFTAAPVQLLYNDTVDHPWEATVENPSMADIGGTYYLVFSGGLWNSSGYAEGYAVCSGPLGPCSQPQAGPFLASYGAVAGPGGGSLVSAGGQWWLAYAAWTAGCTDYGCGGARELYLAPVTTGGGPGPVPCTAPATPSGYRFATADGEVYSFGTLPNCGSMSGAALNAPVVGMVDTHDGGGYWLVGSDGGIFAFGDAGYHGSMGGTPLNRPVVGMAADPATGGYWEVASDGGIFAFDAPFLGSMGGTPLNRPVVGMAATPDGRGYWLVASDGGIFAFGDAAFWGSMGATPLNQPVVGMAADPATGGYWEVASDGGIFAFDAPFLGSMGGTPLNRPVVGMAADPATGGYWEVASDGGIFAFGAPFAGSTGGSVLDAPVVAVTS